MSVGVLRSAGREITLPEGPAGRRLRLVVLVAVVGLITTSARALAAGHVADS